MLDEVISGQRVVSIGDDILILKKPSGEINEEADILYAVKLEEYLKKGVPSKLTVDSRIKSELLQMNIKIDEVEEERTRLMKQVNDFSASFPELKNPDLLSNDSLFSALVRKLSDKFTEAEVQILAQCSIIDSIRSERYTQTAESFASIQKTKFLISKCILDTGQKPRFSIPELTNMDNQKFLMQVLTEWDRFINDIPSDRITELPELGKE